VVGAVGTRCPPPSAALDRFRPDVLTRPAGQDVVTAAIKSGSVRGVLTLGDRFDRFRHFGPTDRDDL